jgi:hypothetical protein
LVHLWEKMGQSFPTLLSCWCHYPEIFKLIICGR